jgi:dihydropyrimidine dehydrogenase (NAD+) subunit PreA
MLLGCGAVQVCTAAMHYGFRIVEDMIDGLRNWMREKQFKSLEDFRGRSLPRVVEWKDLDLNYKIVARIDESKCIGCELCYTACQDGAHQCIHMDRMPAVPNGITMTPSPRLDFDRPVSTPQARVPRVDEDECVGCNLCALVCPVDHCITMERVDSGLPFQSWAMRAGGNS